MAGILLLAIQIVLNVWLMNDVSPLGVSDHQAAGFAAKVNAIHAGWRASGMMELAIFSMILDCLFIGVYSWGAFAGGRMFASSHGALLSRLGKLIVIAAVAFCAADYTETISQLVQAIGGQGSDNLAHIAATVRPVKTVLFLVTFFGLLMALYIRRTTRRAA
ncbi:MAG: hypothetical protein ACK4ZE_13505 [Sphingorhabdus sp.]